MQKKARSKSVADVVGQMRLSLRGAILSNSAFSFLEIETDRAKLSQKLLVGKLEWLSLLTCGQNTRFDTDLLLQEGAHPLSQAA